MSKLLTLVLLGSILLVTNVLGVTCTNPPDCSECNANGGECWFSSVTANDGYADSETSCTEALCVMPITLNTSLESPAHGITLEQESLTFNYTYTDFELPSGVSNCSLWLNDSSGWERNQTVDYPTAETTNSFTIDFGSEGIQTFNWLISCIDLESDQYNSSTWTVIINYDTDPPTVTLILPANNTDTAEFTISSTLNNVDFIFNVTDLNPIANCSLLINDVLNETDYTITRNIDQTFDINLKDGTYNWTVKCSDTRSNQGVSETFFLILTTIFSKILQILPDTDIIPHLILNETLEWV